MIPPCTSIAEGSIACFCRKSESASAAAVHYVVVGGSGIGAFRVGINPEDSYVFPRLSCLEGTKISTPDPFTPDTINIRKHNNADYTAVLTRRLEPYNQPNEKLWTAVCSVLLYSLGFMAMNSSLDTLLSSQGCPVMASASLKGSPRAG